VCSSDLTNVVFRESSTYLLQWQIDRSEDLRMMGTKCFIIVTAHIRVARQMITSAIGERRVLTCLSSKKSWGMCPLNTIKRLGVQIEQSTSLKRNVNGRGCLA